MAGAKRFLSTVVPAGTGSGDGVWKNTTGKPLSVTLSAQAISTDRNACMSLAVGLGTTSFSSRLGIASGNYERYFGAMADGANEAGFTTVFGTFYLGCNCNCPGGSYCASAPGIATFVSCDGTETKNWQAGHNPWNCCICTCAGPWPDGNCGSWCANAFWGGQEQINYGLSFYNEYSGLCWNEQDPYDGFNFTGESYRSAHALGWTNGGTCMYGPCRELPPHSWLVHGCHARNPIEAGQLWVNQFCCCGRCSYESNSISTMAICYGYNDYNCGGYYNWYQLTNNQPTVVCKPWCCNSCQVCERDCDRCFGYYVNKCPEYHDPGDNEVYLNWIARGSHRYCSCFCSQCGRWCRNRNQCCCISQFTDCYSWFCQLCCWQHWSNGWTCNNRSCPMNPYGGVAGAGTHCGIVRHHKTMEQCQMYFIGSMDACTWYCERCSCQLHMLDLWIKPNKYGTESYETNEYSIKYISWNPQKCCTYLAIRSADINQCGIFSWFGSGQKHEYRDWQVGNSGLTCIWPCDTTYFTKVANWPGVWTEEKYISPIMCQTCIHRMEKCLWAMGVFNCDTQVMDPFVSSDLINWAKSPEGTECSTTIVDSDPNNCIVEYMSTTCKWRTCSSFDGAVCKEGILDWKLSFNNYERTGVIIDCDERLFINNMASVAIGTQFNFQIWGYEG